MQNLDVLIIGAGPTGLMMAAECARYGLNCRIIEKEQHRSEKSKATALQARTLEIFNIIGIVEPFLQKGVKLKAGNILSQGKKIALIDLPKLASPYPFVLSLPQGDTEEILENHLNELGVHVEREVELVELEELEKSVKSILLHQKSGEKEIVVSNYVVGCDGAHSFVRKFLNLSFVGIQFRDVFSLADVKIDWKYPHDELYVYPNPQGTIAAFPLPKNRYRLIFQLKRCRDLLKQNDSPKESLLSNETIPNPSLEEIEDLLRQVGVKDAKISDPVWLANFHVNSRLVDRYQVSRFFLAGDAAHIHSPVGGQGMNTGLQDAFNLVWKLAYTIKNQVNSNVLETYSQERHQIAKSLLKATDIGTNFATLHNSFAQYLRDFFFSFITKIPSVQKKIIDNLCQIAIQYHKNCITADNAGYRAPNAFVTDQGKDRDLFSLMHNPKSFILLIFSGLQPDKNQLKGLSLKNIDIPVTPILISAQEIDVPFKTVLDKTESAHKTYHAENGAIYIIRPDTYVGYKQDSLNLQGVKNYFHSITSPDRIKSRKAETSNCMKEVC